MSKLYDYCQKHDNLYLPHVADKFGMELKECVREICKFWNKLGGRMIGNQIFTDRAEQYWHVETCDTPYRRGDWVLQSQLPSYCTTNKKENQHISAFAHNQKWVEHISQKGKVGGCIGTKVTCDWFWIEIDRKLPDDSSDLNKAIRDGLAVKKNIMGRLRDMNVPNYREITADAVKLFYSGNNSTHLCVNASLFGKPITSQNRCGIGKPWYNLAHRLAGNVRFQGGIQDVWLADDQLVEDIFSFQYPNAPDVDKQKKRQCLETIDPNIYSVNSLIRQPWSYHEASGKQKTLIDDNGNITEQVEPLTAKNYPPYLAHLWLESFKNKRKTYKNLDNDFSDDYIVEQFQRHVPNFQIENVNSDGWVNNCYSAFYENDTNPSVGCNIKTGMYKDFGYPLHTFTFNEFLSKIKKKTNEYN